MAGVKISQLPALPNGSDITNAVFPLSLNGTTYKASSAILGGGRFGVEDNLATDQRTFDGAGFSLNLINTEFDVQSGDNAFVGAAGELYVNTSNMGFYVQGDLTRYADVFINPSQAGMDVSNTGGMLAFGIQSIDDSLLPILYLTGMTSGAGYVLTDVAGDGILTLQPASGGGGGSSSRFGVSGEDALGAEDRLFQNPSNNFWIQTGDYTDELLSEASLYIGNDGSFSLYAQDSDTGSYASSNINYASTELINSTFTTSEESKLHIAPTTIFIASHNGSISSAVTVSPGLIQMDYGSGIGNKPMPMAVKFNGGSNIYADGTGTIDLGTISGGGGARFGFSGEDATAAEDRTFSFPSNSFELKHETGGYGSFFFMNKSSSAVPDGIQIATTATTYESDLYLDVASATLALYDIDTGVAGDVQLDLLPSFARIACDKGLVIEEKHSNSTATYDDSSLLTLISTNRGILIPRMTTTQRDAISTPTEGLEIYNTTTHSKNFYNGSSWQSLSSGGGSTQSIQDVFNQSIADADSPVLDLGLNSFNTNADDGSGNTLSSYTAYYGFNLLANSDSSHRYSGIDIQNSAIILSHTYNSGANTNQISVSGTSIALNANQIECQGLESLDYANDSAAAAGGVGLHHLYHSSGALRIRLV